MYYLYVMQVNFLADLLCRGVRPNMRETQKLDASSPSSVQ